MAQTSELIKTLKKLLKRHNKTYADVANCLQLSEASIKRLLAEQQLSLARLDAICNLMGLEISDLVREMQSEQAQAISELTHAQEREIANNLSLMLVTVCVLNQWSMQEILSHYNINEPQLIQHLAHLDRLRIIELLPGNHFRLLVAANFKWRENGPIMQLFRERIESEYFRTNFNHAGEKLIVLNGMLSDANNQLFQRKMTQLAREFDSLSKDDASLSIGERKGYTVLVAMRNWNYERLFRKNNS